MIDRKADTRRKIQLGGLIVKAGLDEEPAAVLLGLPARSCRKARRAWWRSRPRALAVYWSGHFFYFQNTTFLRRVNSHEIAGCCHLPT